MNNRVILIFILTSYSSLAGLAGFLTSKKEDWKFIQSVGGMSLSMKDKWLTVHCDVSGLETVTVTPTTMNSGLCVRKLILEREGNTIFLSLVTSLVEKGKTSRANPISLAQYPKGNYSVEYRDPDGSKHPIGEISLTN